ncbi:hypothetical protein CHLRE_06g298150v5 [Chlamydomonas reinhardtii]|uniref:Uncharacterized protein n=1 Tax=Chlamydomonas reinhardtii TaxID=3055 RepID=A0A2K3DQQ8_CHLRE|nr:uncharacterized protein CHLRE_06g298150v5 [Chlamydomonas reinhardtii]PNW82881.1 hypothetical protein CHLRE_06g298150v5 [Chlamydomonas reinhardtii]
MEVDDTSESLGEETTSEHESDENDDALGHILIAQNAEDGHLLDDLLAGEIDDDDSDDGDEESEEGWNDEGAGDDSESEPAAFAEGEAGASDDGSASDSEAGSEATDSDDQYRRATTRKVSRHAAAVERNMSSGVVADLPTATQRGCLMYARPDVWGAFDCNTKAQHFQTMDCLAVIPPPPPPSRPAAKPATVAGATSSSSSSSRQAAAPHPAAAPQQPPQAATSVAASAPGSAAAAPTPAGPAAAGAEAAAGASGSTQPPMLTLPPPPVPAEDEPLEVLIGGPQRLSVCRVPAPGQPGGLQVVCSAALQTNHYSLAVSPDGRFIATGGDRGFLYIFAYQRGTPQQPPPPSPQEQTESQQAGPGSSSDGAVAAVSVAAARGAGLSRGGGAPPSLSPALQGSVPPPSGDTPELAEAPARLVRLVSFAFPVRGGFWGMNNNIRFGCFGGALRLLVAAQDKAVYIFNVPAWDGSAAALPALADYRHFTCGDLQRWAVGWATHPPPFLQPPPPSPPSTAASRAPAAPQQQAAPQAQPQQPQTLQAVLAAAAAAAAAPVSTKPTSATAATAVADAEAEAEAEERRRFPNKGAQSYWRSRIPATHIAAVTQPDISLAARTPCFSAARAPEDDGEDGAGQLILEAVPTTAAIVDFPTALNCAEPSPDGRWLAVGCDEPLIYLVPAGADYMHRPIEVLLAPLPGHALPGRLAPGCQYVKFNERSDRLAASFDSLFSVLVWNVPQRQLLFTLRHQQWQPPLALSFVPTPPSPASRPQQQAHAQAQAQPGPEATAAAARAVAAAGATSSLLLHATDRQHIVAVDVDAPRTTLTRLSIKPRGQREGAAARPPILSPEPTAQQFHEAAAQEMAAAQAAAAGGAGAQVDAENAEQLLAERAAELRRAQQRERERRARRRARRPPHINGLLTTAEGRLLVATNDEILTFRLLTPATPWSTTTHRLMPPAFRAAVRTLLLAAAGAGAGSPSPSTGAAGVEPGAGAGAAAGPSARPTALSSLPHDAIEHIIAEAAAPRVAWALCEAREVLAFPTLDIWAEQPHQRQREAGEQVVEQTDEEAGGSAGAGAGPSGSGSGGAGAGRVVGWDQDPWQAWDVTNREA